MTLHLIGIGLADEKDISVKGLEAVKKAHTVYLEHYTSSLQVPVSKLEAYYGKKIILADRDMVEKRADETILKDASQHDTTFLIVGDVFSATTHVDLYQRALGKGIDVKVVHNASILTAVGITGLELYKFGKTTSIPFHHKDVQSPVDIIMKNMKADMHTLVLLDLDLKDSRFLTINQACLYLIEKGLPANTRAVGCAALGSEKQQIHAGTLAEVKDGLFTSFPQCLIIPAKKLHFMEEEMLKRYIVC